MAACMSTSIGRTFCGALGNWKVSAENRVLGLVCTHLTVKNAIQITSRHVTLIPEMARSQLPSSVQRESLAIANR
jgi:hypothetical protein